MPESGQQGYKNNPNDDEAEPDTASSDRPLPADRKAVTQRFKSREFIDDIEPCADGVIVHSSAPQHTFTKLLNETGWYPAHIDAKADKILFAPLPTEVVVGASTPEFEFEITTEELKESVENDLTGHHRPTDHPDLALFDATQISGVSATKQESLREAGFRTLTDFRRAKESELAEVDGVGNALAARIKKNVGDDTRSTTECIFDAIRALSDDKGARVGAVIEHVIENSNRDLVKVSSEICRLIKNGEVYKPDEISIASTYSVGGE